MSGNVRLDTAFVVRCVAVSAAFLITALAGIRTAGAAEIAYHVAKDQVFGYEVTVEADEDAYVETLSGQAIYTVSKVDGDAITLKFVGGLQSKRTPKQRGTILRPSFGRFSPMSPMTGLGRTSNTVEINRQGDVLSLQGTSQLPHLLGNLSVLPVESLPGDDRAQWTMEAGTSISSSGGRVPGPPSRTNANRKTTSAGETTSYQVESATDTEVVIRKTYRLNTPAGGNSSQYDISGSGTLHYSIERGIPESLELKETVTTRKGNVTESVPVTIRYRLMSDDEIAEVQKKWQDAQAAGRARLAEMKAQREAPMDAATRNALTADLKSGNIAKMMSALNKLSRRPPSPDDKQLTAAIKDLLGHKNPGIRRLAGNAWAKWSAAAEE